MYTKEQIETALKSKGYVWFEDEINKGFDINIVGPSFKVYASFVVIYAPDVPTGFWIGEVVFIICSLAKRVNGVPLKLFCTTVTPGPILLDFVILFPFASTVSFVTILGTRMVAKWLYIEDQWSLLIFFNSCI